MAYYLLFIFMDPVSVLTVFFKVAMHLPSQQFVFKNKNIDAFSRTELIEIYRNNNLTYLFKKYNNIKEIEKLVPYLKNDKKNNDEKINFILLNRIGKTSQPNKYKISIKELKRKLKFFNQY